MTKRAVLYARVSGDDGHGRNLSDQLKICRDYAQEQGWLIVEELAEDERGVSGAKLDAPELVKALDMASNDEYDVLVVREIDRLARDIGKQYIIESELKRFGVEVSYVLGQYPDTPEGQLNKAIKAAIASYERTKISERMVRGRRREAKRGSVLVHGNPPYGYDVVRDEEKEIFKLVINEEQAEIVKLIFQLYVYGDGVNPPISVRRITHHLNKLGVKSQRGIEWRYSTVRRMMLSETYVGVWRYGKWRASYQANDPDYHIVVSVPAIIDRETWEKAQEQRKKNQRSSRRNRINNYLMSKHLRCGECGYSLSGKSGGSKKSASYICYHAYDKGRGVDCSHKVNYSGKLIDSLTWMWVKSILLNPEKLSAGWEQYELTAKKVVEPLKRQLDIAQKGLVEYEQKLERLIDLYLSGDVDKGLLVERKNRLEQFIKDLKIREKQLQAQIEEVVITDVQIQSAQKFVMSVSDGFELSKADFATQRQIIDLLDVQGVVTREKDGTSYLNLTCKLDMGEVYKIPNAKEAKERNVKGSKFTATQRRDFQ